MRFYKRNIIALVIIWVLFAVALYLIVLIGKDDTVIKRTEKKVRDLNASIKEIIQSKEILIKDDTIK